jgi:hypothetical protein
VAVVDELAVNSVCGDVRIRTLGGAINSGSAGVLAAKRSPCFGSENSRSVGYMMRDQFG